MSNEERKATIKQVAFIRGLAGRLKITLAVRPEDMTVDEASNLLESMQAKERKIAEDTTPGFNGNNDRNKDIKMGLCIKLVYSRYVQQGLNAVNSPNDFRDEVIKLYRIMSDIEVD